MMRSAGSTIARASSGSMSSIRSIEPLISANNAVTVLRSPSTASASAAASPIRTDGTIFCSNAESGEVHCPQNLKPGGFSKRHLGQTSASGAVHCPQNFIPPGFSNPHFEQRIEAPTLNQRPTAFVSPSAAYRHRPRKARSRRAYCCEAELIRRLSRMQRCGERISGRSGMFRYSILFIGLG